MQYANILVAIGGDQGNQVPKYNVSAAEIAVLRAIHGEDAVREVEPVSAPKDDDGKAIRVDERQELQRLRETYGGAHNEDREAFIDIVYPRGAGTKLVTSLSDLDLPEESYKPKTRAKASDADAGADPRPPRAPGTDYELSPRKGRARQGDADLVSQPPGELSNRLDTTKLGQADVTTEDVLK